MKVINSREETTTMCYRSIPVNAKNKRNENNEKEIDDNSFKSVFAEIDKYGQVDDTSYCLSKHIIQPIKNLIKKK